MKTLLLFLMFGVMPAYGQVYSGTAFQKMPGNWIQTIPFAQVTVCTPTATGNPCSPAATLYTDQTFTTTAGNNLITADSLGNYTFFAPQGIYLVCVSGGSNSRCDYVSTGGTNVGASSGAAVPVYTAPGTNLTPDPFIGDSSGLGDWFAGTFTGTGVGGVIRFPCQTQPTTFRGSSLTAGNAYVYCDSGSNLLGCILSSLASCTGTGASGAAGGSLGGSYPNPTVLKANFGATAIPLSSTPPSSGQFLKYDGTNIVGSAGSSATSTPICSLTSTTDTITAAGVFATTCPVTTASISGAGQVIHVVAHGVGTTTGTASPIVKFRVNAGGTTGICTNSVTSDTLAINQANTPWDVTCDIVIATTGAPGTAIAWGREAFANNTSGAPAAGSPRFYVNAGTVSYITNSTQTVSIEETATPVTGQSWTLQSLLVWNY